MELELSKLPNELMGRIFEWIGDWKELFTVSCVSKRWREVLRSHPKIGFTARGSIDFCGVNRAVSHSEIHSALNWLCCSIARPFSVSLHDVETPQIQLYFHVSSLEVYSSRKLGNLFLDHWNQLKKLVILKSGVTRQLPVILKLTQNIEALVTDGIDDSPSKINLYGTDRCFASNRDCLRNLQFLALLNSNCISTASLISFLSQSHVKFLSIGGSDLLYDVDESRDDFLDKLFIGNNTLEKVDITFLDQSSRRSYDKAIRVGDSRFLDLTQSTESFVRYKNEQTSLQSSSAFAAITLSKGKWGNPLHVATRSQDINAVRDLISLGCDVNVIDYSCNTSLLLACNCGNLEIVEALLSAGAAPSILRRNMKHDSPLYVACLKGHSSIVKLLLKYTPKDYFVQLFDDRLYYNNWTPVIVSCICGSVETLRLLLQYGFDMNQPNKFGSTPLHVSCVKGFMEGVKILVEEAKVDVNPVDEDRFTPVDQAMKHQHYDIVKFLESFGGKSNFTLHTSNSSKGSRNKKQDRTRKNRK